MKNDFEILGIHEDMFLTLTMREVISALKKLALKVHPDKAGPEFTEEFQNLKVAYERVLHYVHEKPEGDFDIVVVGQSYEETFVRENFNNFNFPKEN